MLGCNRGMAMKMASTLEIFENENSKSPKSSTKAVLSNRKVNCIAVACMSVSTSIVKLTGHLI